MSQRNAQPCANFVSDDFRMVMEKAEQEFTAFFNLRQTPTLTGGVDAALTLTVSELQVKISHLRLK